MIKNKLKAGILADVHFTMEENETGLSLPRKALLNGTKDAKVYVVNGNKAELRNIKTGIVTATKVQVLEVWNRRTGGDIRTNEPETELLFQSSSKIIYVINRISYKKAHTDCGNIHCWPWQGMFVTVHRLHELLPKCPKAADNDTTVYPGAAPSEVENSVTKKWRMQFRHWKTDNIKSQPWKVCQREW